jgi:hypothetical protein
MNKGLFSNKSGLIVPIDGKLTIADQDHDFSGGRGYIEKDWGQSFPSAWV